MCELCDKQGKEKRGKIITKKPFILYEEVIYVFYLKTTIEK